jgi:hypothetical protein
VRDVGVLYRKERRKCASRFRFSQISSESDALITNGCRRGREHTKRSCLGYLCTNCNDNYWLLNWFTGSTVNKFYLLIDSTQIPGRGGTLPILLSCLSPKKNTDGIYEITTSTYNRWTRNVVKDKSRFVKCLYGFINNIWCAWVYNTVQGVAHVTILSFISSWFSGFSTFLLHGQLQLCHTNVIIPVQVNVSLYDVFWIKTPYCLINFEEMILVTVQTKFAFWMYAECSNISLITDLLCTV